MHASLSTNATFRHGVHPAQHKRATADEPIERVRFVNEYVLPLGQHIGAPSTPTVARGDKVQRGQQIAAAAGFISTALHSPVTGTVKGIELRLHPAGKEHPAIVITIDPFADQSVMAATDDRIGPLPSAQWVDRVQQAGIVGMGGAGFPSHVKLSVPAGKKVEFVVLNGCECEPYLTCDHRVMVESPDRVLRGLRLLMQQTGASRGYIAVEDNKPEAITVLRARNAEHPDRAAVEIV